jgi:hypothetical protein
MSSTTTSTLRAILTADSAGATAAFEKVGSSAQEAGGKISEIFQSIFESAEASATKSGEVTEQGVTKIGGLFDGLSEDGSEAWMKVAEAAGTSSTEATGSVEEATIRIGSLFDGMGADSSTGFDKIKESADTSSDDAVGSVEGATTRIAALYEEMAEKVSLSYAKIDESAGASADVQKGDAEEVDAATATEGGGFAKVGELAAAAVAGIIAGSIDLAEKYDKVVAQYQVAAHNAGESNAQLTDELNKSNTAATNNGFSITQNTQSLQLLASAHVPVKQQSSALNTIMDMARAKNESLSDATSQYVKILDGKGNKTLVQFGININVAASNAHALATAQQAVSNANFALQETQHKVADGQLKGAAADQALASAHRAVTLAEDKLNLAHDSTKKELDTVAQRTKGAAAAFNNTLGGSLDIAKAKTDKLGIEFGQKMLPILKSVVKDISDVVGWLGKHITVAEALAAVVGGVLLAAIGVWIGGMIIGVAQTTIAGASMLLFGTIAEGTSDEVAESSAVQVAAGIRTAATYVAAGVSAVASSAVQVAAGIRTAATYVAAGVSAAASSAVQVAAGIRTAATYVAAGVSAAASFAVMVAGWIASAVTATASGIAIAAAWLMALGPVGLIIAAVIAVGAIFAVLWIKVKAFRDAFKDAFNAIKDVVVGAFDFVKSHLKEVIPIIVGIVLGPIGLLVLELVKHWSTIKRDVVVAFDAIVHFIESIPAKFRKVGEDIIKGLVDGIKAMADLPKKAIHAVVKGVEDVAKDVLGIFSPSKVFHDIGKSTMQGLKEGIKENAKLATDEMKSLKLADSLAPELKKVQTAAKAVGPALVDIGFALLVISADGEHAKAGVKLAATAIGEIGDALKKVGKTPKQFGDDLSSLATLATKLQPGPIQKAVNVIVMGFKEIANADLTPGVNKDVKALEHLATGSKPAEGALKSLATSTEAVTSKLKTGEKELASIASSLTKAKTSGKELENELNTMATALDKMRTAVQNSEHELSGNFVSALKSDKAAAELLKPAFDTVASSVDASSKKVDATVSEWKSFDKQISTVLGNVKSLGEVVTKISDNMKDTSKSASETETDFKDLDKTIQTAGQHIITTLINVKSQGLNPLVSTINELHNDWGTAWAGMGSTASNQEQAISNTCDDIKTAVDKLPGYVSGEQGSWNTAWAALASSVTGQFSNPGQTLQNIGQQLAKGLIQGVNDEDGAMNGVGQALDNGLISGINQNGSQINTAIQNIMNNAIKAAKATAGVKSPSTVFAEIGMNLMVGLANGVNSNSHLATSAVAAVAGQMAGTKFGVPALNMGGATGSNTGTGATTPAAPSAASSGSVSQQINVYAQTNATASDIAAEVGWAMRTATVS